MFPTTGGDIDPRIRHKMREVLLSDAFPVYVDARSKELLLLAREACKQSGLFQSELVTSGLHSLMWFPWTGTRAMRTLSLIFESAGLTAELKRSGLAFAFRDGILELRSALAELTRAHPSPEQLLENVVSCERRKWDCFVDLELLKNAFIQESLDLPRAFEALERLARIVPQT